ncbi:MULTISPECIES: amino acid synthesis family protein [Vreelandella]|jgi:hypothetical protein|uniref:amino acid synthesis family protein n=1 Tax=Vreelandella TaxID=3137766 RepID=UPI001D17D50B|nr:amino acid synthesis family protein [Halomonas meridiana]MCC4289524.1 amino acid synthesis family protein [Halomonas meridiana]|tara:strand:- start:1542 stop:2114 length:573 start_codon:yes stop_codon:yes gene_type:complete
MIDIRKRSLNVEDIWHDGGERKEKPLKMASANAVIRNPFAGVYEPNLVPFMKELRQLGFELAKQLVGAIGKDNAEVYGKAAMVGVNGEIEHAAVWHEAGGWAIREVLGHPKAIVPSVKAVVHTGYKIMVPVNYIHASFVRSHFNSMEVGIQDAPKPDEILFSLVLGDGGRVHSRLGGLTIEEVSGHDGLR